MKKNELRLAILGYGNAGRAYGLMLTEKASEIARLYDTEVKVCAIVTRSKGTLIDSSGIDLTEAENQLKSIGKFKDGIRADALKVAREADYDVLVELTPLDIFSGRPAIDHIEAALSRGKHVISANKGPIAWAYRPLMEMADKNGCKFFFETTVMDGTPVFNLCAETLKMCKVTEINGILNSTTNFILEELAKGQAYDDVIEEGKRRGFVEADPSLDTLGWDAAAKITALMNVLMDADITPNDVRRKGIEDISSDDIQAAAARDKVIKLLCKGKVENGNAVATVEPVELDKNDLLATISGTSSAVSITTDLMGTVTVVENEPEIEQTAYGIFSDTIRMIEHLIKKHA